MVNIWNKKRKAWKKFKAHTQIPTVILKVNQNEIGEVSNIKLLNCIPIDFTVSWLAINRKV